MNGNHQPQPVAVAFTLVRIADKDVNPVAIVGVDWEFYPKATGRGDFVAQEEGPDEPTVFLHLIGGTEYAFQGADADAFFSWYLLARGGEMVGQVS